MASRPGHRKLLGAVDLNEGMMKLLLLGIATLMACVETPGTSSGDGNQDLADAIAQDGGTADLALDRATDLPSLDAGAQDQAMPDMPPAAPSSLAATDIRPTMLPIPAGTFRMGTEQARAMSEFIHTVQLTRGFWIGRTEVTTSQWEALMGNRPFDGEDDRPVGSITWFAAVAYSNALSRAEGLEECYDLDCEGVAGEREFICSVANFRGLDCEGYRLPTDAEWEYAARAGSTEAFYGPLDDIGWYKDNSGEEAHLVTLKKSNDWGLYDVIGNVAEWTNDPFRARMTEDVVDPLGGVWDLEQVFTLRGGHYNTATRFLGLHARRGQLPWNTSPAVGFRPARTISQ